MCQANLGLTIPYTMLSKWVWEWYFVLYRQNVLARGPKRLLFFDIVQKMELWIKIIYFANLVFEFWRKSVKWVKNKWAKFPHKKIIFWSSMASFLLQETSFTCDGKEFGGYYADPEMDCQAYHICLMVNTLHWYRTKISMLGAGWLRKWVRPWNRCPTVEFASFMFWKVSSRSHHDNQCSRKGHTAQMNGNRGLESMEVSNVKSLRLIVFWGDGAASRSSCSDAARGKERTINLLQTMPRSPLPHFQLID